MPKYATDSWNSSDSETFGIREIEEFPPDLNTPQLLRYTLTSNRQTTSYCEQEVKKSGAGN